MGDNNKDNKFNINELTKEIISLYLESKAKGKCKEKDQCECIDDYEYEEKQDCKCKHKDNYEYEEKDDCKCECIGDFEYSCNENNNCIPKCICPKVNPQHCCSVILEHKTCLVPPYVECGDIKHTAEVEAEIEMVCPGKVIICGVLHKKIEYTALMQNGAKNPCYVKCDDVSFQCYIDADEANEGDKYNIEGVDIVCSKGKPVNEGRYRCTCKKVFWAYEEKDVIKIAVKRVKC